MEKRDCQHCIYAFGLERRDETLLVCSNLPGYPGQLKEVVCPGCCCRNFDARRRAPERTDPAHMPLPPDPSICHIPLTQGKFAIIDAVDYERVSKYKWSLTGSGGKQYAQAIVEGKHVLMHRFLLNPPQGMLVDHKDGNGLNNRQCNTRTCTPWENSCNRRPGKGAARFTGVYRCRDKWEARLGYHGEQLHLGVFDDPVEAAKARDRKALELYGEYAWLNFPEEAARYRTEIADSRSQIMSLRAQRGNPDCGSRISDCGSNEDVGGKPRGGKPSTADDREPRVTTAYRSQRVSKGTPSSRPSALTMRPGRSHPFAAARLACCALRRNEMCATGCRSLGMANTMKTPRPAPWWHRPRVYLPFWWTPLIARGPPDRQVGAGFKPAPTEDTNYGLVSRMSSM